MVVGMIVLVGLRCFGAVGLGGGFNSLVGGCSV